MTTITGINMNATSSGSLITVTTKTYASIQVVNKTGTHTKHVVRLLGTLDNTNFVELGRLDHNSNIILSVPIYAIRSIKYDVYNVEGATSTADITILTV